MTKRPEGLLKQPVNDRCNNGSDKREKGIGYRKKEIGPEQSDTPTNKPEQFVTMKTTMKGQAPQTNLHTRVKPNGIWEQKTNLHTGVKDQFSHANKRPICT